MRLRATGMIAYGVGVFQIAAFIALSCCRDTDTLRVPSQFKTIQAAITAARNGDCVLVAPGDYLGPIDFLGKRITVRSEDGPIVTRILAPRHSHTVSFVRGEPWQALLDGFSLLGGGGVLCRGSAPTIRRNKIECTSAMPAEQPTLDSLAGVFCTTGSAPALLANHITGRGIVCEHATALIRDNHIYSCSGGDGAGICCRRSSVRIEANVIRDNHAAQRGGGIFASESRVIAINNVVAYNNARHGAGLHVERGSLTAAHNTIVANQAAIGGGLASCDATVNVVNAIIWNNTAATHASVDAQGRRPDISHSIVGGGWSGTAVLDADPCFIGNGADFHISFGSPARGRGRLLLGRPYRLDLDGNDRRSDGRVDLGADEFAPHLYAYRASPDAPVTAICVTGSPGTPVLLGCGSDLLTSPITYSGCGFFWLYTPVTLQPLRHTPLSGTVSFPVPCPAAPSPKGVFPVQAWIGLTLSRPVLICARR